MTNRLLEVHAAQQDTHQKARQVGQAAARPARVAYPAVYPEAVPMVSASIPMAQKCQDGQARLLVNAVRHVIVATPTQRLWRPGPTHQSVPAAMFQTSRILECSRQSVAAVRHAQVDTVTALSNIRLRHHRQIAVRR